MMKILAIDVGGTAIKSALAAPDGTLAGLREYPTPPDIARGILQVAASYRDYGAVGISTAGIVDHQRGTIVFSSAANSGR